MNVTLLTILEVNWPAFIDVSKRALGRSPVRTLDQNKMHERNYYTYIAALQELSDPGVEPKTAVHQANEALHLIHFSFCIECTNSQAEMLMDLPRITMRKFVGSSTMIVATASLADWRLTILEQNSVAKGNTSYRNQTRTEMLHAVYEWLVKLNLKELFPSDRRLML